MSSYREDFFYHFTDDKPREINRKLGSLRYEKIILRSMAVGPGVLAYDEVVDAIEILEAELFSVMVDIMANLPQD